MLAKRRGKEVLHRVGHVVLSCLISLRQDGAPLVVIECAYCDLFLEDSTDEQEKSRLQRGPEV